MRFFFKHLRIAYYLRAYYYYLFVTYSYSFVFGQLLHNSRFSYR